MHFSKKILLTAAACLAPVLSSAAPVTSNPSLSLNGLQFNNFSCGFSKGGIYATPNNCGQIDVQALNIPNMVDLRFSSDFLAAPASFDDATIGYHVSSASGISSVGLSFDGTVFGLAITEVTETVKNSNNQIVGFLDVVCGSPQLGASCSNANRDLNIALNGTYTNLYIEKDVKVNGILGTASASVIDQTFSNAPEPGSTALLGSGLLAVAGLLRRRSILGLLKK